MYRHLNILRIAVIAVVAVLAGLNLYQYFTREALLSGRLSVSQIGSTADRRDLEHLVIDHFHKLFYYDKNAYWANQWWGISTLQNPNDVWIIQEIISEVKPDFVLETGTYRGGSAALWAMVLEQVNPAGRVITIDIEDQVGAARKLPIFQEKVDFLVGGSTDPKIIAEVRKRVEGHTVVVILDSDHHKEHVLRELELYAPLVSVGSYIVVQDTNINGHPVYPAGFEGPGPMEAVEEFLASNGQFVADQRRERLLFTMHPRGYLKRVR